MNAEERQAWLAERRGGIGSSDAAACIGYKPKEGRVYGTPLSVYLDKLGLLPPRDSQPMKWGRLLEGVVAAAYQEETGRDVLTPAQPLFRHPALAWMLASPDRLSVGDDTRILECKTANAWEAGAWGVPHTDEVPEAYLIQVQHQLAVLDLVRADIAVLIGGQDFRVYTVERDDAFTAHLAALEHDFWRLVEARTPPEPDWQHPDTPKLLELLHRPKPGVEVALESTEAFMVEEYEELGSHIKGLQIQRDEVRARLCMAMGEAELGRLPDGRTLRRKSLTRKQYTMPETTYVEFRILKPKKGERDGD